METARCSERHVTQTDGRDRQSASAAPPPPRRRHLQGPAGTPLKTIRARRDELRASDLRTLALSQHVAMLNDQLHQWRETLSASACNHRRNALTNLVKVLYGQRAAAELIDLVRFTHPPPKPRWLERSHITDVLARLTPESKTVVRLSLMHWTGMRPSRMARLQPDDFRLGEPTPFLERP